MVSRKLILYAIIAQLVTFWWILLKIFLLPYLIWKFLGTSSLSAHIGDLTILLLGTLATLTMGLIGYWHASRYPLHRSPVTISLASMLFIYAPLFLFLLYKSIFESAWDNYWTLYLSGWLSIVTHPMILVGFYGKWVDWVGTLVFCGSYLLGVWIYFDEAKEFRRLREE